MALNEIFKDAMTKHQNKIKITQWAIINSISSFVYTKYLMKLEQRSFPTKVILCPTIKSLVYYLDPMCPVMERLSLHLIEDMSKDVTFKKYNHAPELILFNDENIEIMKTIYDLYISQNITRRIPETIQMKFGLDNDNQQTFREDRDIMLFPPKAQLDDDEYNYIVHQSVLQLLQLLPTMKKDIFNPANNMEIFMGSQDIFTVSSDQAICPIHFDKRIIENEETKKFLPFITNTEFNEVDTSQRYITKGENNDYVEYIVRSGQFNQTMITTFNGITTIEENIKEDQ